MILLENLSASYPDRTEAVSGVSLKINQGERVALIGANGAGKTSLLLSLVGLLPLSGGRAEVCGLTLTKDNLAEIRRRAGFIFQNPDDQLFMPTVYEDIAFGLRGRDAADKDNIIKETAERLSITHLLQKSPARLSGGEKRSAALAGVLAMAPTLLLADEPSSFLDPRARRNLIALLGSLPQTLFVATHDIELALALCPRVVMLYKGRVAADGAACEILSNVGLLESCGL